jgi:Ni2+-binding GTPase involved in maturation of urease and hydrogenase
MSAKTVSGGRDVLVERRAAAERFRATQARRGTLVVQLISAPEAGKTALLEAAARYWDSSRRLEDVGNLVGPAPHDVGQHLRAVLLSVTEGDDKPDKYPKAFRSSDVLVLTKLDLLPHVPFSVEAAAADARRIRPDLEVLSVNALAGAGIAAWCAYLARRRQEILGAVPDTSREVRVFLRQGRV